MRRGRAASYLPPMGARFRLKPSFNVAGFCASAAPYCADAKAVLTEMQHYGLILADNGSNWFFQGSRLPAMAGRAASRCSSGSQPVPSRP